MAKLTSFYRPHKRVQFTGEVVDPKTGELVKLPSMTKQEFKTECDINNIVKSFKTTGMFNHVSAQAASGRYEDLPDPEEFQDSLNLVQEASAAFMSLPSKLRARFDNDPTQFLAFATDPANLDELRELGLARVPEEVRPTPVTIMGAPPSDAGQGETPSQPKA